MGKKDRLSYSALSSFAQSPNHLLAYWNNTYETTPAMLEGTLGHLLILEADKFEERFRIFDGRRAGKVWLYFKSEVEKENPKLDIISKTQYDKVSELVQIAMQDNLFQDLLSQVGETEKYIQWKRKGIDFHGYIDIVADDFLADIKFCQDSGDKFRRDLIYGNSHMQGAMYLDPYDYDRDFMYIAIEKKSPYNVQIYRMGRNRIEDGRQKYLSLIDDYKEWDGSPQGYANNIIEVM